MHPVSRRHHDGLSRQRGVFVESRRNNLQPAQIRPVPKSLVARGKGLVKGIKVDLDAALPEDDV